MIKLDRLARRLSVPHGQPSTPNCPRPIRLRHPSNSGDPFYKTLDNQMIRQGGQASITVISQMSARQ